MDAKKVIRLIAEVLSGTQVPRSLSPTYLGAATKPWDLLRYELHICGWLTADEIEKRLLECLGAQERDWMGNVVKPEEKP